MVASLSNCDPSLYKHFPTAPSAAASAHFSVAGSKSSLRYPLMFPGLKPWISGATEVHPSASAKLPGPGFSSRARTPCGSSGSRRSGLFRTEVQHPFPSDSVAVWGGQFDSCLPLSEMPNSLKLTNRQIDGLCLPAPLGQRELSPLDASPKAAL